MSTSGSPLRRSCSRMPARGASRLLMDVVRQRLERRHVDDLRRIRERRLETLPHQVVDRGHEGGERLARSRGRRDERVAAGLDRRPRFGLRGGRRGETLGEPVRDRRVEQGFDDGRRLETRPSFRPRRFAPSRLKRSRSASGLAPHGRRVELRPPIYGAGSGFGHPAPRSPIAADAVQRACAWARSTDELWTAPPRARLRNSCALAPRVARSAKRGKHR